MGSYDVQERENSRWRWTPPGWVSTADKEYYRNRRAAVTPRLNAVGGGVLGGSGRIRGMAGPRLRPINKNPRNGNSVTGIAFFILAGRGSDHSSRSTAAQAGLLTSGSNLLTVSSRRINGSDLLRFSFPVTAAGPSPILTDVPY